VKTRLILITLILAAVAAVPFVYAGPGGHGFRSMHGRGRHGLGVLGHLEHI